MVIPKEIRRTLRIREGDPSCTTLTPFDLFSKGLHNFRHKVTAEWISLRCLLIVLLFKDIASHIDAIRSALFLYSEPFIIIE
ncbi:MAG: hypothetical protein J6V25_07245 [Oscillospiraceae bacterium]|nr:hypothetical protein [Oscillospiraceae bacterium]